MSEAESYDVAAPSPFGLRLHHVQLCIPAGAEPVCRAFWVGDLQFIELRKPPELAARGGLWIRAGELEIHLGVEAAFVPARKAHPGIVAGNLDALAERLVARGHEICWDDAFPGMRRFYVTDPVGNRLEFLAPDGSATGW